MTIDHHNSDQILLFHYMIRISETLRALYLGDNEFEFLPPGLGNLKNLQIVSLLETFTLVYT